MKKICLLLIGFMFYYQYANSQVVDNKTDISIEDKIVSNVEIGAGIFAGTKINGCYTYIMPQLEYMISPKLSFSGGVVFMQSSFDFSGKKTENLNSSEYNSLQSILVARAKYNVNQKLRITGEVLYGNSILSGAKNKVEIKSYSVGADYKINDNFQIGIQIRQTQSNSPYLYNNTGFRQSYYGPGW